MDVYLRYLQALTDVIFPPRNEALLVRSVVENDLSALLSIRWQGGLCTLLPYQSPLVKALAHEAKFHHNQHAFLLLGTLFRDVLNTDAVGVPPEALLVPIPLSARRLRERGYNQVTKTLEAAALTPTPLLLRTRHTPPQTDLDRRARLHNLMGAFAVDTRLATTIDRAHPIILIDDVSTTGATLKEGAAALRAAAFTNITCIALAH